MQVIVLYRQIIDVIKATFRRGRRRSGKCALGSGRDIEYWVLDIQAPTPHMTLDDIVQLFAGDLWTPTISYLTWECSTTKKYAPSSAIRILHI
jgi:hypothetical protein